MAKNKIGAGKTHFVQTVARPYLNAIFSNPSLSNLRIPCVPTQSLRLRVTWASSFSRRWRENIVYKEYVSI